MHIRIPIAISQPLQQTAGQVVTGQIATGPPSGLAIIRLQDAVDVLLLLLSFLRQAIQQIGFSGSYLEKTFRYVAGQHCLLHVCRIDSHQVTSFDIPTRIVIPAARRHPVDGKRSLCHDPSGRHFCHARTAFGVTTGKRRRVGGNQIASVSRKPNSAETASIDGIVQHIEPLSALVDGEHTFLLAFQAHGERVALVRHRQAFDDKLMGGWSQCHFAAFMLLAVDIDRIMLDALHGQPSFGKPRIVHTKTCQMQGIAGSGGQHASFQHTACPHGVRRQYAVQQVFFLKHLSGGILLLRHERFLHAIRSGIAELLDVYIFGIRRKRPQAKGASYDDSFVHITILFSLNTYAKL